MTKLLVKWFIKDREKVKDTRVRTAYGKLAAAVAVAVNLLLAAAKLLAGVLTASVSIVADAVNNASDAATGVISFITFRMAAKPADRDHPYGHGRIEYLTSAVLAVVVCIVGVELLLSSVQGFLSPSPVGDLSPVVPLLLALAVIAKIWLGAFQRKIGTVVDSEVLRASSADSVSDAVSTAAVLLGTTVRMLFPSWALAPYIDSAVGAVVSVFIVIAGLRILNDAKNLILGAPPSESEVNAILSIVRSYPDVLDVHDVYVHSYGPGNSIASLHAEVDGSRNMFDVHDTIDNIEMQVFRETGVVLTIHTDPVSTDGDTALLRAFTEETVREIDERLSIHDFRTVPGTTHTNLIFDVSAPFECKLSPKEIASLVGERIHEKDAHYYAVVHVDRV